MIAKVSMLTCNQDKKRAIVWKRYDTNIKYVSVRAFDCREMMTLA
jgi:hypothetical protein